MVAPLVLVVVGAVVIFVAVDKIWGVIEYPARGERWCRLCDAAVPEGRSREECVEIKKEREQELRLMMKRLEAKYAALQVVPVISKLGTQRVSTTPASVE